MDPNALDSAVTGLLSEYRAQSEWHDELQTELQALTRRMTRLEASIAGAISLLPSEDDRRRHSATLAQVTGIRPDRFLDQGNTGRTAAVLNFLCTWSNDMLTPQDLRISLERQGHSFRDQHEPARILQRKMEQGYVARVSRGHYRVTPKIASLRSAYPHRVP